MIVPTNLSYFKFPSFTFQVHNRVGSVVHSFFLLFLFCSSTVFLLPLSSPAPLPLRSIEAEGERSKNGEGTEQEQNLPLVTV